MHGLEAALGEARHVVIEILRPVGDVLQAAALGLHEVAVHRRRIVALLDQFDLHRAGIGERDRCDAATTARPR